jgi:Lon protease-like protein
MPDRRTRRGVIATLVAAGLAWVSPIAADVDRRLIDAARAQDAAQGRAPALPAEIPLFPLPDVVLFPNVERPLLIFEPRYREMVADALKGSRILGMVALRPGFEKDYDGRPPIYGVGCAGVIGEHEQLPDGRSIIVLRGFTRFRVVSEDQRKPYRLARVEAIPERLTDEDLGPLSALRERLARLLVTVLPPGVEPPDPSIGDTEYVNLIAQALQMSESERQDLLERDSVLGRARALVERLELR